MAIKEKIEASKSKLTNKALHRILLSATSMRKEITISMCVRGNEEDEKIVERFFDLMEESIKMLID